MIAFHINVIIGRRPFGIFVTFNMAASNSNINLNKVHRVENIDKVLISNFTLSQLAT